MLCIFRHSMSKIQKSRTVTQRDYWQRLYYIYRAYFRHNIQYNTKEKRLGLQPFAIKFRRSDLCRIFISMVAFKLDIYPLCRAYNKKIKQRIKNDEKIYTFS